jgi:hypothetical protein
MPPEFFVRHHPGYWTPAGRRLESIAQVAIRIWDRRLESYLCVTVWDGSPLTPHTTARAETELSLDRINACQTRTEYRHG